MNEYFVKKLNLKINPDAITIVMGNSYTFINTLKKELHDSLAFVVFKNKNQNGTIQQILTKNKVDLLSEKYLNIIAKLKLNKLINSKTQEISNEEKILLGFIILLYHAKNRIIIEEEINYLNNDLKEKIFKYINAEHITLVMITNNIELSLYSHYLLIINEEKIVFYEKKDDALEKISELKALGCNVPFIVDLSMQLKYYDAIDKLYFNNKDLVGELWK